MDTAHLIHALNLQSKVNTPDVEILAFVLRCGFGWRCQYSGEVARKVFEKRSVRNE